MLLELAAVVEVVGFCWMLLGVVGCCWLLLDVVGCMPVDVHTPGYNVVKDVMGHGVQASELQAIAQSETVGKSEKVS